MTTASTSTVLDMTSDTGFRNWIAEIIAQMAVVGLSITTDTGQVNTSTVTRPATNTAAGFSIFRFTDTLAKGGISTVNAIVGGSGYTNGTYTAVPLTGGSGTGAQATIVVAGGVVTTVTITTAGSNYLVCDQVSAAAANIGGTGSGFTAQVNALTGGAVPIVMKLEYGTAGSAGQPQMWITAGQSTNGAGTIAGSNQSVRAAVCPSTTPLSAITAYTSRWCFNATAGFFGFSWKLGAFSSGTISAGSIFIHRSHDNTGAASSDSYSLWAAGFDATAPSSNHGCGQNCSFLTNTNYPTTRSQANNCAWLASAGSGASGTCMPYNVPGTTFAGNSYLIPVYYLSPNVSISNWLCCALTAEAPIGNTFTTTIVGSTSHTYISLGMCFGSSTYVGTYSGGLGVTMCMLWE